MKKKSLWYNHKEKEARAIMQEGGEAIGMRIEHMAETEEGRSLLASYYRVFSTTR